MSAAHFGFGILDFPARVVPKNGGDVRLWKMYTTGSAKEYGD